MSNINSNKEQISNRQRRVQQININNQRISSQAFSNRQSTTTKQQQSACNQGAVGVQQETRKTSISNQQQRSKQHHPKEADEHPEINQEQRSFEVKQRSKTAKKRASSSISKATFSVQHNQQSAPSVPATSANQPSIQHISNSASSVQQHQQISVQHPATSQSLLLLFTIRLRLRRFSLPLLLSFPRSPLLWLTQVNQQGHPLHLELSIGTTMASVDHDKTSQKMFRITSQRVDHCPTSCRDVAGGTREKKEKRISLIDSRFLRCLLR